MNHSRIDLAQLSEGLPGLTAPLIEAHCEAILICFEEHYHQSGVQCDLNDLNEKLSNLEFVWVETITEKTRRAWRNRITATEWGAAGIAFLVVLAFSEYTVIEQAVIGTGFDYWLGYEEDADKFDFQPKARLEVSGILSEQNTSKIKQRVKAKMKQTKQSDALKLPAYIVVVEFSHPVVYMVRR